MGNNNSLQVRIMQLVSNWVKEQKEPIPQRHIVVSLEVEDIPPTTIKAAVRVLVKKGYLRRAISSASYIQLRSL